MTELGESVTLSLPGVHDAKTSACPFCPEEPAANWTTFAGARNNSRVLAEVLRDPSSLTNKQAGARPKRDEAHQQPKDKPSPYPESPTYTFEAHHLISGKQALKAVPAMEDWITGSKIDGDTGYSVNNGANGIWLPSVPKTLQKKGFGDLTQEQKFTIAVAAMDAHSGQFHKGPHNIQPSETDEDPHHDSYDSWLKAQLETIAERIRLWSLACPVCAKRSSEKQLPRPTVEVNAILDRLSTNVRAKVTGHPKHWHIFISKVAYWYHLQESHQVKAAFEKGAYAPEKM
jgi:hypothetical protein